MVPVDALILAATLVAWVAELVVRPDAPDMICVPFTVMPLTNEFELPENVIVEVPLPTALTTGANPTAPAGPVIVTEEPDAVAE